MIRRRVPALPPSAAAVAAIRSILGCSPDGWWSAANAAGFLATLAADRPRLDALVAEAARRLGPHAPNSVNQLLSRFDPMQSIGAVAQGLQDFGSAAVLVLIYLGFLIASRHAFERKAVRLFATREARHEALNVFLRIRDGVERYLWVQTVTGLIIAIASLLVMVLVGLDNAMFWAFLIFILGYVPIMGRWRPSSCRPCSPWCSSATGATPGASCGGAVRHQLRGRQHLPAAHAGRQPQHGPADRAAVAGLLGHDLGPAGRCSCRRR